MSDARAGETTNLHHIQLMDVLGIDSELTDRSKKGLRWCYKKYKAFNDSVQSMDQMTREGKWPSGIRKPGHTELVEIFMSKSYWHSHVSKPFALIARYPQMVAWLEDDESPSDFDVWHIQKSDYGFKELKEWLKGDGTLDKAAKGRLERSIEKGRGKKAKGKGKEKEAEVDDGGKEKGKGKEKEVEVDDSGRRKGKASTSSSKTHKRK